jgi:hypothetical protein
MPAPRCTRHVHRGPQDFRPSGRCVHCAREAQKRYRRSCQEARHKLRALEALLAS